MCGSDITVLVEDEKGSGEAFACQILLRASSRSLQLQPLVPPQVLHFMQVPLRTSV